MSNVRPEHMRFGLLVAFVCLATVACSGTGQPTAAGPPKVVEIDAGNFHTCARLDDGTVECWGQCSFQCGVRPSGVTTRMPVAGITNAVELAVGDAHACARLPDGDVACWGSNYSGGLGRLEPEQSLLPLVVPDVHEATAIAIDGDRTCARMPDGTATCWGAAARDYDRSVEATRARLPALADGSTATFLDEVGRATHGTCDCRLDDASTVRCVGTGILSAQLADGSSPPIQLHDCPADGLADVRTLAEGCAIMNDGTVQCWSERIHEDHEPTAVDGITDAVALARGASHSCVLATSGELWCWGGNAQGQVDGTPSETDVSPPRRL